MKLVYLNALVAVTNEIGEEKIQRVTSRKSKGDSTTPKSWFIEQKLIPPNDAEELAETDENGNILLGEEDVDLLPIPLTIPLNTIGSWVANAEGKGSVLYTTSNLKYLVLEEVWEIDTMIEYLNLNFFEKIYLYIKIKLKLNNN